MPKTIEVDLALLTDDAARLRDWELSLVNTATQPEAPPLDGLHTVPGIGHILRLVLLYEIHDIRRFPSVQDVASYARVVTCSQESAGKRWGPSGKTIGNAHRKWAFCEAATLFRRHKPNGQKLLTRFEKQHGKGTALTSLAHHLTRAVYDLLKRNTAVAMAIFWRTSRKQRG